MIEVEDIIIEYLKMINITPKDCILGYNKEIGYYIKSETLSKELIQEINNKILEIERNKTI